MRFTKKLQLNDILKVSYKSFIILLILVGLSLDLGLHLSKLLKDGWIVDWNGKLSIYGKRNYGLFISNYFLSFSTVISIFSVVFLAIGAFKHRSESRGIIQSYSVGLFIVLSQIFMFFAFTCVVLPALRIGNDFMWSPNIILKIIVPVLMFCYVMFFMENKSWYGVRESITRFSLRIIVAFSVIIIFYWLIWLSKYVYSSNSNQLFNIRFGTFETAKEEGITIGESLGISLSNEDQLLMLVDKYWNNHDVINNDFLFHFSNTYSSVFHFREWLGVIVALSMFLGLSFGVVPILSLLNNKIVSSPKYIVNKDSISKISGQIVDLRGDVDTLDLTPISTHKKDKDIF